HDVVRQEMREVLGGSAPLGFLDLTAESLLGEARLQFARLDLANTRVIKTGEVTTLFTWRGDSANDALGLLLRGLGIEKIENEGLYIEIARCDQDRLHDSLSDIAELRDVDYMSLLTDVFNMRRSKWDWVLSDSLLRKSFASSHLSFEGARACA